MTLHVSLCRIADESAMERTDWKGEEIKHLQGNSYDGFFKINFELVP